MLDHEPVESQPMHPMVSALIFAATVFLSFILIGPLIGFMMAMPFYPGNFMQMSEALLNGSTTNELRMPMIIMQACATGFGLIVIPMIVYRLIIKKKIGQLFNKASWMTLAITTASVIVFMFPDSIIIEWNANLKLSGPFWSWARELEDKGMEMTKFITNFQSPADFLLVFIVVAVLAAIGEEFCFRGWLQPALHKLTGNPHVAIWLSAMLFSAFHFQFFGFVPRMLLGAMFGYLLYWSNNLWLPIVAHLVNNGFGVLMVYLHQLNIVEMDPESTESLPWMAVVPFTILFAFLIFLLKKSIDRHNEAVQPI